MPAMIVETARLGLRTAVTGDAAATAALTTADLGAAFGGWQVPTPARADLAIVRSYDRRLIGWIGVGLVDPARRLGALTGWLGDAFRGRGYMAEAAPAALPWLVERLGLRAIEASMRIDDFASQSIVEKLGFQIKARRTVAGVDRIVFAVPCARLRLPSVAIERRLDAVA